MSHTRDDGGIDQNGGSGNRKKWLDYRIYLGSMIIKICQSIGCWVTEKSS